MPKGRKNPDIDEFCSALLDLCVKYRLKPITNSSSTVNGFEITDIRDFEDWRLKQEIKWARCDYLGIDC